MISIPFHAHRTDVLVQLYSYLNTQNQLIHMNISISF